MSLRRHYLLFVLTFLLGSILPSGAYGQGVRGEIVGTVKDSSGAIVPNVQVKIRNEATNITRTVSSSQSGEYSVPLLDPGSYEVSASAPGFEQVTYTKITLQVAQTVRVDVTLTVGAVREQVEVTTATPLVQTDTSSLGQVVTQTQMSNLPLNERNFVNFAYLAPGVQIDAQGTLDSTQGLALSANGSRETNNNFLINGIDDNDLVINGYSALPPVDAIQEFKVQTGSYSAEYGRSAGAQINVELKSGTNSVHGTAYEYLRNRNLDSKNVFDLPDCTAGSAPGSCGPIPGFDRSQFGGSIGGPIKRNKTFFFASFEYLKLRQAATRFATVPSQTQIATALAAIPPAQRNPAGVNILNLYPAANVGANLQTSNTFLSAPIILQHEPFAVGRVDHQFSEKDSLTGTYTLSFGYRVNPFDPLAPFTNLPGYGTDVTTHGQNGGVTWTHSFNPRIVNEFRAGFNAEHGIFLQADTTDHNKALGFPDVLTAPIDLGFPNVSVAGFDGIGQPTNTPQDHPTYTMHLEDNYAWNPEFMGGKHAFKAGFETRRYFYSLLFDTTARGIWTFNGTSTENALEQLLAGTPSNATSVNSEVNMDLSTTSYDGYIQDDYHASSNLTLNLGLRYEYNSPVTEAHNLLSVPDFSSNSATCTPKPGCEFIVAGTHGLPRATYLPDGNNFAPRIGFAWRPLSTNRFVIRAAYGIFYDVTLLNAQLEARLNPPFRITNLIVNPTNTATIQNIFNQPASLTPPGGTYMALHYRDPYEQEYNFNMQFQPANGWLLDTGYVGNRGLKLTSFRRVDQPLPGQPIPFPQFQPTLTIIDNSGDSYYNSLQVKVEKSTSHGFTFLSAYTWSRCIDDGTFFGSGSAGGTTAQNPDNFRAERGLCQFNANQRWVANGVYQLPWGKGRAWLRSGFASKVLGGWDISAIATLQSGHPYTVSRGVPQSNTVPTGGSDRPNVVGNPNQAGPVAANPTCIAPAVIHTTANWFNPCAFVAAPGQFGNLGRDNLIGPPLNNIDFTLQRDIPLDEARRLQISAQAFNLTNTPHYDLPNNNFDSKTFSQLLSANAYGNLPPRQIQLVVRFIF